MEELLAIGLLVGACVLALGYMVLLVAHPPSGSLAARVSSRGAAACLVLIALGLPVVVSSNERFFPWSFLFSLVALLIALRTLLRPKAAWASWSAIALVGFFLAFTALVRP